MAVQVTSRSSVTVRQPFLPAIELPFESPFAGRTARRQTHPTIVLLRRRRLVRRLRRAAEAGTWAVGSAALMLLVLTALAGLR
jgi:hypothetical protein